MGISIENPVRLVNVVWYISLLLVFIFCICAIAFGAQNANGDESDSGAIGFAGIWTMLLAICLAGGGTFVLRKNKTPPAVGFLLGVVVMMCVNMLVLTALLDQEATNCEDLNNRVSASQDTCLARGCQMAFYNPAANQDPELGPVTPMENEYMACCRSFTAIKYGNDDGKFRYEFGVTGKQFDAVTGADESSNAAACPACQSGECDGSVAAATFAAFLFVTYGAFAVALGKYRGEIIASRVTGEDAAVEKTEESTAVAYPVDSTDSGDVELEGKDLSQ